MSKVITFSRTFPAYHPRKGEPTYFVEKIWESIGMPNIKSWDKCDLVDETLRFIRGNDEFDNKPKHHTIRAGKRWKVGDKFSPRVWSGTPYKSKQIIIAPDIEIVKVWDIDIINQTFFINKKNFYERFGSMWHNHIEELAKNDGLSCNDLYQWFKMPCEFSGQIICWNNNINY